MKDSIEFE